MRAATLLVVLSCVPGCLPFALPPARADLGLSSVRAAGREPGAWGRVSAGVHTTAFAPDWPVDVGLGIVGAFHGEPNRADPVGAGGAYGEVSLMRTWKPGLRGLLGPRVEWLETGGGVFARAAIEVFGNMQPSPFSGSGTCGGVFGIAAGGYGIGFFLESGYRWFGNGDAGWAVTAGVTVRTPAAIGVAVGYPWCSRSSTQSYTPSSSAQPSRSSPATAPPPPHRIQPPPPSRIGPPPAARP